MGVSAGQNRVSWEAAPPHHHPGSQFRHNELHSHREGGDVGRGSLARRSSALPLNPDHLIAHNNQGRSSGSGAYPAEPGPLGRRFGTGPDDV